MNTKKILFGLAVFGAGIGTGYFACKLVLGKRYQEDVSEIKQFYMNKIEEMGVMAEDFDPEDLDEDEDDDTEDPDEEEYRNTINKFNYSSAAVEGQRSKGRPIINYSNPPLPIQDWGDLEEGVEDEKEEEDEMDLAYEAEIEARAEEFARRKFENRSNGRPYVIDYEEYMDGPEDYELQALYYYSVDRVLCEDDDAIVEDEEELVGFDYEDVLDMQTTAWVRNDTLMVLYEIHRIDESYKMTVENAVETPREREYRVLGRRKQAMDDVHESRVFLKE